MRTGPSKREFELEALEPRILLSGDGLLLGAAAAQAPQFTADARGTEIVELEPFSALEPTSARQSEPIDLFSFEDQDASQQAAASEESPAPSCPAEQEQSDDLSPGPASPEITLDPFAPTQPVSTRPEFVETAAQQLTETLRAANGPPADSAAETPGQLIGTSTGSADGGSLVVEVGQVLAGNVTFQGGLFNAGLVSPGNSPGVVNVSEFTQGSEGTTLIEIGGTAGPGIDPNGWDQINVSGLARLGGTVQIQLYGGFVPSLGNSFLIFTWTTAEGEFANWLGTASIPGHPTWSFKPTYSATGLTLTVVETPALTGDATGAINAGLGTLANVSNALEGLGAFAESIPMIGTGVASLIDPQTAILNAIQGRISSLLATLPRVSQVTSSIEGWDGTNYAGFTADVKGVLGHYGSSGAEPVWWDINLELSPAAVNRSLQDVLGGVFGAMFNGSPTVNVSSAVVLDISFGYESGTGFFVGVRSIGLRARINATGLSGFGFSFNTPGGTQSLNVNGGSINLDAAVLATPDESILTGGRITQSTLAGLGASNIGNAFNLNKIGTLDAVLPLTGSLSFAGFSLSGTYVVYVQSDDLFTRAPELSLGVASTLTIMGQTLTGTFTFRNTGTQTVLEAENVSFQLGAGTRRVLSVQNGFGTFALIGGDLAGVLTLDFALGPAIPNITLSATGLTLALNTSESAVSEIAGTTVNLPAGRYYRVRGHGLIGLTTPQASLEGDFAFEPRDADSNPGNGYEEVAVGVANLSFGFGDGTNPILSVTNGTGAFVFRSQGIVGSASATVALAVSGLGLSGSFSVSLNNSNTAYNQTLNVNGTSVTVNVPAGPFLRVSATSASLTVQGIGVTGNFTFERTQTTTGGEWVVTVAASGLSLNLGATANNLLSVTGGSGAFIITATSLAGTAGATVSLNVPGVTIGGSFAVSINNSTSAVSETVSVGASTVTIDLPAGPYLRVSGTGVSLGFLGATLTGNFTFEQRTSQSGSRMITVTANSVSFNFGTSLLTADNGNGFFAINDAGIAGKGSITVHVNAFGTGFSHTFDWAFNTMGNAVNQVFGNPTALDLPAGPFNKLDSGPTPITINVPIDGDTQSISISGRFIITLVNGTPGYLTVAASDVSALIGSGTIGLQVSQGSGAFVIYSSGIAGEVKVQSASLSGAGVLNITAQNLKLQLNNTGADVGNPSPVVVPINDNPADNVSIRFVGPYYHNYLAVAGTAEITGILEAITLGGNFVIERAQIDTNGDSTLESVFKLGVTDLHLSLNAGSLSVVSFDHGTGAMVLSSAGLAADADLQFETGLVQLSGTIGLKLNTTGAAVNASVTTPNGTRALSLSSGNYVQIAVDGHIHIGSVALPFQLIVKVAGDTVEFRRAGDNVLLVAVDSAGNFTLGPPLAAIANFDFAKASPIEWVVLLRQLGQWFDSLRDSSLFDVEIPFTGGKTLGDAFDWSKLFLDSIYKYMVSVELQSRSMFDTTVNEGTLGDDDTSGEHHGILTIQLGEEPAVTLLIQDDVGDNNTRDGNELVTLINTAIGAAALSGRVVARINKDKRVVIALTEDEIAKGTTLTLVEADAAAAALGFEPGTGVLVERWSTEGFFSAMADILNDGTLDGDGGAVYDPRQNVYTYLLNLTKQYGTSDLFGSPTLPFNFDISLGPIGSAALNGALEFTATVGFQITLGFDLGAAEVPRVFTSGMVPVPANGKLSADAHFGIYLNEAEPIPTASYSTLFPITLPLGLTSGNNSIENLAEDLNQVFATVSYAGGKLSDVIIAQKAGNGLAISAKPDKLGIINRIIVISPKNDPFATEMGFGMEAVDLNPVNDPLDESDHIFVSIATSPMKGLFIQDATLTGALSINTTAAGINGSINFGFVEISTSGGAFGTLAYDGVTTAPISATLSIENQTTGEKRFYINELLSNTSSNNISNLGPAFEFGGSLLARLANISVGGLGFTFPLGSNPEISIWIPDITELNYNSNPYDPETNNKGIFLTYPNLGNLDNFTNLNFTQIIKALNMIADTLSQLSAFSFLDEPLPFVNISVNDMLDYASKFADLIDAAASSGSQSSLQKTLAELEHQIEVLFNLNPNTLTVSLDENGAPAASLVTAGGSATAKSSLIVNYNGDNNAFTITAKDNGSGLNGSTIRVVGDSAITDASARVVWDANAKRLTIKINPGKTTASAIVTAINAASSPWNASLAPPDPSGTNTGQGTITTVALKFSFVFSTAYANSLPFQLDLKDLLGKLAGDNPTIRSFLDLATTLVQIKGEGQITVSASAALTLDFGFDVSTPGTAKPFFYDSTGVDLLAKVTGTNINIEASLGSVFGIFIKNGRVTLDKDGDPDTGPPNDRGAVFRLGLNKRSSGRYYFDENWFNLDSIDLRLEGGVSAQLPIFAPLESSPLSGSADNNTDGYPDNYLVIEIPDLVTLFISEAVSTRATGSQKTVKFAGLNNDILVKSDGTYTDFKIIFLDTLSGNNANASFNTATNTLTVNIDAGVTTATVALNAIKTATGAAGHFAPTELADDDGNPTTTSNDGTGKLEKLFIVTPNFSSLFDGLQICDVIANSLDEILAGLDKLLGWIEDGLNEIVFNTDLPLVGKGLKGAANFISNFRNGLLRELQQEIEAAGGNGLTAMENAIKKALWNSLGPGGLNWLVDYETGDPLDVSAGFSQLDVTLDCETGLKVNIRIAKSIALLDTTENPIDFDIGVPGFGLEVDGNVVVSLGFDLKFGFGVDLTNGFYFNTSAPASDPELRIYFRAEIPGLHAAGQLLFLQLDVMDDSDSPSFFEGAFEVDLADPNHDNKLTMAELFSSGTRFKDIIHAVLGAEADVNLNLIASFGGNTAFPRVLADFHLGWTFDTNNGAGDPQISFTNIRLDLGTFISDFLGPILKEIRKVTEPVQPIIDIVTARLPVISDLAGQKITLLDLAELFGLLEPSTVDFIQGVLDVVSLINKLEGLGEGTILIPFGSFNLLEGSDGRRTNIQALENIASRTMDEIAAAAAAATASGASSTYTSAVSGFVSDVGSLSNFSIPIFDNPAELFNLFIGEPVRLVEWRMPTFKFKFNYTQKIPIYPPLYAQFGGTIGADINIGFGYDTYGIQKYISSEDKNWVDILDGFYVLDFDASGNEQPELRLYGELFAGASINLVIVEAGVKGGLGFELTFDLNDVNDDGKVRVSEIIANAQQDPRCIFDISGKIYLFLEAFLKIDLFFFSIDKTWRFAEITLFSFEITCPQPVLAERSGTDLLINIGSRAPNRLEIDTSDSSETFIIKHTGGDAGDETVEVQWANYKQTFEHVGHIVVSDAGQGDDYLDFRGVLSTVEVHGGSGNDTIFLGDGKDSKAFGDDGNDTITASPNTDVTGVEIHGGAGNDILVAGPTAIKIWGDAGNDTITGSPEADELYGDDGTGTSSDGDDTIDAGDGNDLVRGGLGNDTIEGGPGNDWIRGDGGNDIVRGSRGDDFLEGGTGDDKLYGSSGNDLLLGGGGSDWANGHGGIDLLIGDDDPANPATINSLPITQTNLDAIRTAIAAIPTNGITLRNIPGDTSTAIGNDILIGGGNIDVLFGGPGDDFLYGGNFLNNGETEPIEEDDNDFFDGGPGNDSIFGDDSMGKTGDRDTGIAIQSAIFFDLNKNGLKDADELGFGGVTVTLYRNDDLLIGSTKTDVDGSFKFTGLDPDRYYMTFSSVAGMNFIAGGSAPDAESAANDSDVYPTGPLKGRTPDFQLTFDETERNVTAGYEGDPLVSINDVSVTEGNTGQTTVTLTVTLSGPQRTTVTLNYRTKDGDAPPASHRNAIADSGDYIPTSGTLVFAPGETSKTINVVVLGDITYEEHQQFQVILSNPSAGIKLPTLPETTALVTIINDDAVPQISIADYVPPSTLLANGQRVYTVPENTTAEFIVSLSNPSEYDVTVWYLVDSDYSCACGENPAKPYPAYLDGDYNQPAPAEITFKAGEMFKSIKVHYRDDDLDEPDERIYVDLFNPAYARISDGRAYGIIPDDDAPVSVSIHKPGEPLVFSTAINEGSWGYTSVPIEVSLSKVSGHKITVSYATSPGTAVEAVYTDDPGNGPDYEPSPNDSMPKSQQTIVFAPGELTRTIRVKVFGDTRREPNETFFVNLINADNADIAANPPNESNHYTITINNDDAFTHDIGPWSVFFGSLDYEVQEPDSGIAYANITIHRTPGSSQPVAVFYTTNGTATAGADYGELFRQLVYFAGNETTKVVRIPIYADDLSEGDETVFLYLRNPTGGNVRAAPDTATLTIHDADVPVVSIRAPLIGIFYDDVEKRFKVVYGVNEGTGPGSTTAKFTISLDKPAPPGGVTVDWATVRGTALTGDDYTFASGTASIPENGTTTTVEVIITRDADPELTEQFYVRLSSPVRATLAKKDFIAACPIYDDDLYPVEGMVFYDTNGNGFLDIGENGIADVSVTITWMQSGIHKQTTVKTAKGIDAGKYTANVALGQVSISVDGTTVKSPFQDLWPTLLFPLFGSGSYVTTTNNEVQAEKFDGVVGISPFTPVGYKNSFSFTLPEKAKAVGRGGTDDTIFGGPGNDTIDAGAGDDHVIGGHWQTATDSHMPVNNTAYNATVVTVTKDTDLHAVYGLPAGTQLHPIYDSGPIFSVTPQLFPGAISGEIWLDGNGNNVQNLGDTLFTKGVLVVLLDEVGNPVNAVFSTDGKYLFTNLFVDSDHPTVETKYVVQFELPDGYTFVEPNQGDPDPDKDTTGTDSDAEFVNRTRAIAISAASPTKTSIDAGVISTSALTLGSTYQFSRATYSVSEVKPGYVEIIVTRKDTSVPGVVVVKTQDGTGPNGAKSSPDPTRNYEATIAVLVFDVGEQVKTLHIRVFNRHLGFTEFRYFTLTLNDATGRPYDTATVYIVGEANPTISDDDNIQGGLDWDIILGDSGNIPGYAVVAEYQDGTGIEPPEKLGHIRLFGGPGNDTIDAGIGADYIDGQLGDDVLAGGDGVDIVMGSLGDDEITVGQGDDDIRGDHGKDTVISVRSVAGIVLSPTSLVHQQIQLGSYVTLNEHILHDTFEVAKLTGDSQANRFELKGWATTAFIDGAGGNDALVVESDTDMILKDASNYEKIVFAYLYGFRKDASINLPTSVTYHLSSLENVVLTGGDGSNTINAAGYSRPVTFVATKGNDTYIGGSSNDTFQFLADSPLDTITVTGNGGADTLDFTGTVAELIVHLETLNSTQDVNGNLTLILKDYLENVTGGFGNDKLYGNALDNVLIGGPGDDLLAGGPGNETYVFDTDLAWGSETIVELLSDPGTDTLDFSPTTGQQINLNMGILDAFQAVNANLQLKLVGEGIEEVFGGALNDVIRGNGNNNILHGGPGVDLLDGKNGDDILDGGPGNDTLLGGEGTDRIDESANASFTLTNKKLIRGIEEDSLDSIEIANLTGGPGADSFTLTGWTGTGSINGAAGIDTIVWEADANFILTDTSLTMTTGATSASMTLSSVERATLVGGQNDNSLDASNFSGRATLVGNEGNDTLIGGSGADILRGGPGNDTLTGNGGNDILDGGAGDNSIAEDLSAATWKVSFVLQNNLLFITQHDPIPFPIDKSIIDVDTLIGIETAVMVGSANDDSFDVSGWTTGSLIIQAAGGTDTVKLNIPTPTDPAQPGSSTTITNSSVTFTNSDSSIFFDSVEQAFIVGTANNDTIDASAFTGTAFIYGKAGDDIIMPGPGANWLEGGDGDDLFIFLQDGQAGMDINVVVGGNSDGTDNGIDTLDLSAFALDLTIDLSTLGSTQTAATDELYFYFLLPDIENIIGGSGDDMLLGNDLDNTFTGGPGGNFIHGAGGTNTIVETADADFTLTDTEITIAGVSTTLSSIQKAVLTGGSSDNTIDASAFTGQTTLIGLGGNDFLSGGSGNDVLVGGAGDDILSGNGGDDTYRFNLDDALGEDFILESPGAAGGFDTLDFSATTSTGVIVDLSLTTQQTVHATNLKLTLSDDNAIENIIGTRNADVLIGNDLNNIFIGGLGDDLIIGNGGTLDTIWETRDANFELSDASLRIGTETDTLIDIRAALLVGGKSNNIIDATMFSGIASLVGMGGNDTLYGGSGNDILVGGAGDDTLRGNGGNDSLLGGFGNDTYIFDLSFDQGEDTLREDAAQGFADTLLGIGPSGLTVNLHITTQQLFTNLKLTLLVASTVEFSF